MNTRLPADEQTWLDAYCQVRKEQHPGVVARMVIYGSKARGDDHPDSDLKEGRGVRLLCAARIAINR